MTTSALVFGARGQIGHCLLPRLREAQWQIHAVSRELAAAHDDGIRWHRMELYNDADSAPATEVIFSLGPLDGFASWFERSPRTAARVIAFGSTSIATKQDSDDPHERDIAARLQAAESRLAELCDARGARLTVLRPTLIYGVGMDRNLTRIAQLARRWGVFALPRGATGRRQPVHADDLAAAALQAAVAENTLQRAYDLPGGEILSYRDMVARTLACLRPRVPLLELPSGPLRAALWCAHRAGALGDAGTGVLQRLRTDMVFDIGAARRDLHYVPRAFSPRARMFDAELHRGADMLQRTM